MIYILLFIYSFASIHSIYGMDEDNKEREITRYPVHSPRQNGQHKRKYEQISSSLPTRQIESKERRDGDSLDFDKNDNKQNKIKKLTINEVKRNDVIQNEHLKDKYSILPLNLQDPMGLKSFFEAQNSFMLSLYNRIYEAKINADIATLFRLREDFDKEDNSTNNYEVLVRKLLKEIKGEPVSIWAGQNLHQFLGSLLFYPVELIQCPVDNGTIYSYPGIAASLAISASYGNPVALYKLSSGFCKIAAQCRITPANVDEEENIEAQNHIQSQVLREKAVNIFRKTQKENVVAQFYLLYNAFHYGKTIQKEKYLEQLNGLDLADAFYEKGLVYENMRGDASIEEKSFECYYQALERGCEAAVAGAHRMFSHKKQKMSREDLYAKGRGQSLFLKAQRKFDEREASEEIKELYIQSGQLGRLRSYITLAEAIGTKKIAASDFVNEAIEYYKKADRPGFAEGARIIIGQPGYYSPAEKVRLLEYMISLKDLKGYEHLLTCYTIEGYRSLCEKVFPSREQVEKELQLLLEERENILKLIGSVT